MKYFYPRFYLFVCKLSALSFWERKGPSAAPVFVEEFVIGNLIHKAKRGGLFWLEAVSW